VGGHPHLWVVVMGCVDVVLGCVCHLWGVVVGGWSSGGGGGSCPPLVGVVNIVALLLR
jgi:hypothetical protein